MRTNVKLIIEFEDDTENVLNIVNKLENNPDVVKVIELFNMKDQAFVEGIGYIKHEKPTEIKLRIINR